MWTFLNTEDKFVRRSYKFIYDNCRRFIEQEDLADKMTIPFEGGLIPAINSLVYVATKSIDTSMSESIEKYVSLKDAEAFVKAMPKIKRNENKSRLVTKKGKSDLDKSLETSKLRYEDRIALGDNSLYVGFSGLIRAILGSKSELAINILAESVVIANMTVNGFGENIYINPFTIHCLILFYCMYSKVNVLGYSKRASTVEDSGKTALLRVNEGESFKDLCRRVIKDDYTYDLSMKYVELMMTTPNITEIFYDQLDDWMESTRRQAKESKDISDTLVNMLDNIYGARTKITPAVVKAIGKRHKNDYTVAALAGSAIVTNFVSISSCESLVLYILKQHLDKNNTLISKDNFDFLHAYITEHSDKVLMSIEYQAYYLMSRSMQLIYKSKEEALNSLTDANKKLELANQRVSEAKQRLRKEVKNCKELKQEVKEQSSKNALLQGKLGLDITPQELEQLRGKISRREEEIKGLREELLSKDRQISRKEKELASVQDKLESAEEDYLELVEKYDRLNEQNSTLALHREYNMIPIECFVNAISNYKIVLIGGDMMFEKIRGYGLTNITLVKAGSKDIKNEDIVNKDLVVLATAFLDHSTMESVPRVAKVNNIELMRFNNKNADMLIYQIFETLNKA